MSDSIEILLGEVSCTIPAGSSLYELKAQRKPEADVLIVNGAPATSDVSLQQGDAVVLIQRGEIPSRDELEALMVSRHTPGVHAKVRKATVGIAGAGGLGSSVAIALARVGVGRLIVADFDVVEPSNLNRQQYFVDQIGQPKVEALAANLARINPYVSIQSHGCRVTRQNLGDLFGDVDVMVEAFDRADQKAMLATGFGKDFPDTPLVLATGLAGHMPSNTVVTRTVGRSMIVVGDMETAAAPGTGLMAPRVGVAAHHQANAVLRIILGENPEG
jgi:sulfur carrier protein ThiS adenylyltransferase